MQQAPSARAYVVYDTAKADHSLGLTHYAITVGENGPDSGFAEWRVLAVPSGSRGRAQTGWATLTPEAFTKYWQPVQECAAKRQD
jgi:hypothetical protein